MTNNDWDNTEMTRRMEKVHLFMPIVKYKMDYGQMIDLLLNDTHFHNSIHVSMGVYRENPLVSFEYYKTELCWIILFIDQLAVFGSIKN
jgi:hypothetical protein